MTKNIRKYFTHNYNNYFSSDTTTVPDKIRKVTHNNAFLLILISILPILSSCGNGADSSDRNNDKKISAVREKGSQVMPFDIDKTLHIFNKTSEGGVQIVKIREPEYTDQLIPIQEHLKKIAIDFKNGNFGDPSSIHGIEMPGLPILEANSSKFSVTYADLANGAKLEYISKDEKIIAALHLWFDAQLNDHGSDATESIFESDTSFSQDHICQMHPETCGN